MDLKLVAAAQVLATLSGALFWLALALLLHPFAFGEVGWLYSLSMLASTAACLGLGKSMVVSKSPSPHLSFYLTLLSSTVSGAALSLLNPWAGLLVFGLSLFSLSFHLELSQQDSKGYLLLWLLRSALLPLPVLLYLWGGKTWLILFGLFLSHFLPSIPFLLKRLSVTIVTPKPGPKIVGYLLSDLGSASLGFLDKVAAGRLLGMEVLGLYYFSTRFFYLLAALPQTLFFYSLSTGSKGMRSLALKSSLLLLGTSLPLSFLVPQLFPDYSGSTTALRIILLSLVPATVSQVCSAELLSEQKPAGASSAYAATVPFQLLSLVVLGRRFGLLGLSLSFLLTQSLLASLLLLLPRVKGEGRRTVVGLACLSFLLPLLLTTLSLPRFEHGAGYVKAEDLAMDTLVRVTALDENLGRAREAVERALQEIHRLEDLLSSEKEGTEIWRLNHSSSWVDLSPETVQVLQEALRYAELSGGAFDPSIKPLVDLWMKKVKETGRLPSAGELEEARALVNWRWLVLENGRARFEREGMQVTLGGIAKGYAADRACEILRSSGVGAGMVQIGGEIRVFGKSWRIGIQHPRKPEEILQSIELTEGAVSTSGDYVRMYFLGSLRIHHIINPRTGEPATECQSVTVVAGRGVDADALSTAAFVLGPTAGKELLENLGVHGLFVTSTGEIRTTENWCVLL